MHNPKSERQVLVTGGGGFLGQAIIKQLLTQGCRIRSLARGNYPGLEKMGVETIRGDLADRDTVLKACDGCDEVFHVAAKAGMWGDYKEYYNANVVGTRNIIDGCKHAGSRLIYTSTPSVVFNGENMAGVDESVEYPDQYTAYYPKTKAMAEKEILSATSSDLKTVILRPHLIWGPGDNHLVPRLLARADRLWQFGKGENKVDAVYIDNAAHAHILAAQKLRTSYNISLPNDSSTDISGKVYFITQGEPFKLWPFVNQILVMAGKKQIKRKIPLPVVRTIGSTIESIYKLLSIDKDPPITRYTVDGMGVDHWFDISRAKKDLGYEPIVSVQEGLERLKVWLEKS